MAITYHAGRRVQGLDSEKPVDISTTEIYNQGSGAGSLDLYTAIPRVGIKAVSGNTTGHINKIKVFLRAVGTHTSTNEVYVRVRKISDDSIVATATKTIADLTSGATITEYEFDFGSCVEITEAEHYVLVEYAYGDASNYLGVSRNSSGISGWEWLQYSNGAYSSGNSSQSMKGSFSSQVGHVCSTGDVQVGSRYEATDTKKMYYYTYDWFELGTTIPFNATRGVFGGGSATNVMDYITIATVGNATDFGDLSAVNNNNAAVSSDTRGVFAGGEIIGSLTNVMDYITIATTGNATDFGDLTVARRGVSGVSSDTRGVIAGGHSGSYSNVMDYITIASTGNATDFGDLTTATFGMGGVSSDTRGVYGGGDQSGTLVNVIQYITIASTGNSTDFGDLTVIREGAAGVSSDTRGVYGGGNTGSVSNVIDYITIATTGNATDFGDLTVARRNPAGVSSATRGVFGGGSTGSHSDIIDYITIATVGNATDFGDLTVARSFAAGVQGT